MHRLSLISILLIGFTLSQSSFAAAENVKWTGVSREQSGYHTPSHANGHSLEFVRQDDKKAFDVVDSEGLLNTHAEKEKNLLVEVEGEITPRFLFWGGNLVVKNFKVLNELDEIPHREPVKQSRAPREFTGGRRERL